MAYKVKQGDTLGGIAKRYDTSIDALMEANPHIKDKNLIQVGWDIQTGAPKAKTASTPTPTGSVTASGNITDRINELNKQKRDKIISELDRNKEQALSNIGRQEKEIKPKYYKARNDTATQKAQSARNFAEFMASRGGTRAGSNAQAELIRNVGYQGALGDISTQETSDFAEIGRMRTDTQNQYLSQRESALAEIEAERMQQLIAEQQRQEQIQRELEAQEIAQKQFEREMALRELQANRDHQYRQQQLALQRAKAAKSSGGGRSGGRSGWGKSKSYSGSKTAGVMKEVPKFKNQRDAIDWYDKNKDAMIKDNIDLNAVLGAISKSHASRARYGMGR